MRKLNLEGMDEIPIPDSFYSGKPLAKEVDCEPSSPAYWPGYTKGEHLKPSEELNESIWGVFDGRRKG